MWLLKALAQVVDLRIYCSEDDIRSDALLGKAFMALYPKPETHTECKINASEFEQLYG